MLILALIQILPCLCKFDFYDESYAKEMTALAFVAQCPQDRLQNWNVGWVSKAFPASLIDVQVFENTALGTYGYIGYNPVRQTITIGFRASANDVNWVEDLTFDKVKFNDECNCKVHNGFKLAYTSLKDKIPLQVYFEKYPSTQVNVLGHSMGAALATLCGVDIGAMGRKVFIQTLGSPRVGDPAFYQYFQKFDITHYRIVNNKDYAPHVPMHYLAFRHVEREIWYHDEGYTICSEDKDEDKSCSYSVKNPEAGDHKKYLDMDCHVDCFDEAI